jgi:L-ascorbate metabolism protein UlaG (beta-lactamase superfamily)
MTKKDEKSMVRKRYENLDNVSTKKTFADFRRWQRERKAKQKNSSYQVPHVDKPEHTLLHMNRSHTLLSWIGHSTFVIQVNGTTIVTDPVWANRLGTVKRLSRPGIPLNDMPDVDIVLISHSHYDHLNFASIRKLKGKPRIFVPMGLGRLFRKKRIENVVECTWWEEKRSNNITLTFVPAQHWTRRSLFDMNTSHWGGWIIQADGKPTFYFAGDSGYFRGFKEIGDRFLIDYALLPIGAYEPEWFMGPQHVTPEEAVQAFVDCKAKTFIPMHYGTFPLADDTPEEALDRLLAEWKRRQLDDERLKLLKLGEILRCD